MLNSVKYNEYRQVGRGEKIHRWKDQLNFCEATVSPLERALLYKTSFLDFGSSTVITPGGGNTSWLILPVPLMKADIGCFRGKTTQKFPM